MGKTEEEIGAALGSDWVYWYKESYSKDI
jgi:hypothetical protein